MECLFRNENIEHRSLTGPIRADGIRTNDECQISTTSNVAKEIFVAPINFGLNQLIQIG